LDRLRTVPGLGTMLRLVWLDDIHDSERVPRGPAFAAYGRLVTCAKASAGKRSGTSGTNIGQAHLTWACSEAAV
jgi:transposase IS116/IS110/IS902 family protein